jgi:hypothetical protein
MYEHTKTQVIIENSPGRPKDYSFTDKEWKVLGTLYLNQNLSIREIWGKCNFEIGETTIARAICGFMI